MRNVRGMGSAGFRGTIPGEWTRWPAALAQGLARVLGRIVFTQHAMPAIRPVNHLVDDQAIIVRSHLGAAIVAHAAADDGVVVCYEADELDPVRHTGWSVIATGMARLVRDPDAITRYQQLLEPWVAGRMDYVIAIRPQIITGIRLVGWCR